MHTRDVRMQKKMGETHEWLYAMNAKKDEVRRDSKFENIEKKNSTMARIVLEMFTGSRKIARGYKKNYRTMKTMEMKR